MLPLGGTAWLTNEFRLLDCNVSCTVLDMITFREEIVYDEKLDVVLVLVFK